MLSHDTPQEPLLQLAAPCDAGSGHGAHRPPHEAAAVLDRHVPLHASALSMQAPLQSF